MSLPRTPNAPPYAAAPSRRPTRLLFGLAAMSCGFIVLAGCSGNPRTEHPFENLSNPFAGVLENAFHRPSESGFLRLAEHYCASFSVGDTTVGALLTDDTPFRALSVDLYGGEISNGEYINRVVDLHPADNANIPATGCVIDQLQNCFSGRCEVATATGQSPPPQIPERLEPGLGGKTPPTEGRGKSTQLDALSAGEAPEHRP